MCTDARATSGAIGPSHPDRASLDHTGHFTTNSDIKPFVLSATVSADVIGDIIAVAGTRSVLRATACCVKVRMYSL